MLSKLEGIVLKTRAYGETNKVVILMTEESGKIAVMARGAKKPSSRLSGVTQPFTHGNFLVAKGKGMGTLQQGEAISTMRHIQQDIEATAYASYVMEMVDRLVENDRPEPGVFHMLRQALHAIEEGYDPEAISLFVEWKMLPFTGVQPTLSHCAGCGSVEGEFAFSFGQGGFLCHRCFHMDPYIIRLTPTQLKLIRIFYNMPIDQVGNLTLKKETKRFIKNIVSTIYEEQSGMRFKSKSFITQLERTPLLFNQTEKQPPEE